eukprot:SAG31_NODE_27117_length_431_cov_0.774096_1_plen_90_part_00
MSKSACAGLHVLPDVELNDNAWLTEDPGCFAAALAFAGVRVSMTSVPFPSLVTTGSPPPGVLPTGAQLPSSQLLPPFDEISDAVFVSPV